MKSVQIKQVRDLTIWEWTNSEWLVFSIDNLAGIGECKFDVVKAPPEVVGYFTARVGLFELIAAGVTPNLVVNTLSVGGDPGKQIITGIRDAIIEAGLPSDFPITGSTEENVFVNVTALGLTVIGSVLEADFRPGRAMVKDEVWLIGTPKAAPNDDVFRGDTSHITFAQLHLLTEMECVHDILPIGSKGCRYEATQIAELAGLHFVPHEQVDEHLFEKSGGPATSAVIAGKVSDSADFHDLQQQVPCTYLGMLEAKQ